MTLGLAPTRLGALLALGSGVAFALQPVLVQLAAHAGGASSAVLTWRYVAAAVVLLALARRRVLAVPPRVAALVVALGLVVYAADTALYYAAVARTSASLASLLHYGYIAVVIAAAAALGRERLTRARLAALAGVLGGITLVGGAAGVPDELGIAFALAAAAAYAAYVLLSDRLLAVADPAALAALLMTGAATSFLAWTALRGGLTDVGGPSGAGLALATAVTGSIAVVAFLGGVRHVGPSTASLLVTVEVPVTLVLAAVVLGDRLTRGQVLGGALVLAAVLALHVRPRQGRRGSPAAEP